MNLFEDRNFVILITILFPLMLLAGAVWLQSSVCVIISLFSWVGLALMILYIPQTRDEDS